MNQHTIPPHPSIPAPRARSVYLVIAIIGGSTVAGALFLGWCAYLYYLSGKDIPINDLDRVVVVTARDFDPYIARLNVRGDAERYIKKRFADGHVELQYTYTHPQDDLSLYIDCSIRVDPTELEAKQTYVIQDAASRTAFKLLYDNGSFEPRDEMFQWGDQSIFGAISSGGKPVGSYFSCRKGRTTFTLQIHGAPFDEVPVYSALVTPALNQLSRLEESLLGDDEE